jgi:hypothetical protein
VTAIAAKDGVSTIECWQLPSFKASADKGIIGSLSLFLGDTANATYTVLPPRFNGGAHNAPVNQYVHISVGPIVTLKVFIPFSYCLLYGYSVSKVSSKAKNKLE